MKKNKVRILWDTAVILMVAGVAGAATGYYTKEIDLAKRAERIIVCQDQADGTCEVNDAAHPLFTNLAAGAVVTADQGNPNAGGSDSWWVQERRSLNRYAQAANTECPGDGKPCSIPASRGTFTITLPAESNGLAMCSTNRVIVHFPSAGDHGQTILGGECWTWPGQQTNQVVVDTNTYGLATSFRIDASVD